MKHLIALTVALFFATPALLESSTLPTPPVATERVASTSDTADSPEPSLKSMYVFRKSMSKATVDSMQYALRKALLREWDLYITPRQVQSIRNYWNYGKPHGYEWSLSGLHYDESSGGEHLVNNKDKRGGSYGGVGTTILGATKRNGHTAAWTEQHLVQYWEVSAFNGVTELNFWYSRSKDANGRINYQELWSHYNGGYDGSFNYSQWIRARIWVLKKRLWITPEEQAKIRSAM